MTWSDLVQAKRQTRYPPWAVLGAAYEFGTGKRLDSADFQGAKSGAVKVLENLGFTIKKKAATS